MQNDVWSKGLVCGLVFFMVPWVTSIAPINPLWEHHVIYGYIRYSDSSGVPSGTPVDITCLETDLSVFVYTQNNKGFYVVDTFGLQGDEGYTIIVNVSCYGCIGNNSLIQNFTYVSEKLNVTIYGNLPPDINKQQINGPTAGSVNETCTYSINSFDPNGDNITYGWDWNGDQIVDEWTDWYLSGETCMFFHSWNQSGVFRIQVTAKDVYGAYCGVVWSFPLRVLIGGETLYVGGIGPENYTSIQAAINVAKNADTIYVYNGEYNENIIVNKSINLLGDNRYVTIIDGGGSSDTVRITASNVVFSNFTCTNSGSTENNAGIVLQSISYSFVCENIVEYNGNDGIRMLSHCHENIISGNVIANNNDGFNASDYYDTYSNSIKENVISDNARHGIYCDADYNKIFHNNLINNTCNAYDGWWGNIWDDGYPSGGNYWSDYNGSDNFSGPGQNLSGSDSIGDTYYPIPTYYYFACDHYPLMNPYDDINPVIFNVEVTPSEQVAEKNINISAIVMDNLAIDDVYLHILYPDMTMMNFSIKQNKTGDAYYCNKTYNQLGNYTFDIWASDTHGNTNFSPEFLFNIRLNNPPYTPNTPSPPNNATGVDINSDLSWIGGDPDSDDMVTYDVYFGNTSSPPKIANNQSATDFDPGTMNYNIHYFWRIVAWDNHGASTFGPIWSFTSKASTPPVFGNPSSLNGSTGNPLSFTWSIPINDPEGDVFSWTIQCSNGQTNSGIGATNGTKSLALSGLSYLKTYKVWVNATDPTGSGLYTRKWYAFTTQQQQNVPPNKPNKPSGTSSGKIKTVYTYTTNTTDPNGDQVYYMWDWGDGSQSSWLGPYNSGVTISTTHKWTVKGQYSIKVKAKDTSGAESPWSDPLPITMPYSYNKPMLQFLELLFERFPHAFPLLRHFLGW